MNSAAFIGSFCSTDDFQSLASRTYTNVSAGSLNASFTANGTTPLLRGISFTLGEFSPCFNDVAIIGSCNVILVILCLIRLYQSFSPRFYHYKMLQPTLGVHYFHIISCFLVALMAALQLSGTAGSQIGSQSTVHPFEVLSYSIFIVTWICVGLIFLLETCERYEKQGASLLRFGKFFVLAGMTIKLYYLIELKEKTIATNLATDIMTWSFFEVLFLIQYVSVAFMALISLCYMPGDAQFVRSTKEDNARHDQELITMSSSTLDDSTQRGGLTVEWNGAECPEYTASCCSQLLFNWMTPLMSLGSKRPLENSDMWMIPKDKSTAALVKKFNVHWELEQKKAKEARLRNKKTTLQRGKDEKVPKEEIPSITRALIKTFGWTYAKGSFIKIFNDLSQFVGPVVMKALIIFVRSQTTATPQPMINGYLLAVVMYFCLMLGAVAEGQYFQIVMTTGLQARGVIIS